MDSPNGHVAFAVNDASVVRESGDAPSRVASQTLLHPREASEALVASLVGTEEDVKVICCCKTTGNIRVLFLTAMLFVIITTAQLFAAVASNSKALLADCYSMGVDSATYFLNILSERMRGSKFHRPFELSIAFFSQGVLVYFCIDIISDAWTLCIRETR